MTDSIPSDAPNTVLSEVMAYIGFGDRDAVLLKAAGPILRPHFAGLVEAFYDAVEHNPGASRAISGPAQRKRLEVSLLNWLEGLFGGVYDDLYLAQRSRIGEVHVRIGLEQRYMFAAMGLVREHLITALIASSMVGDQERQTRRAINRICDIELAIMLESYRDAYTDGLRSERQALAEDLEVAQSEREVLMVKAARHEALATIGTLTAGLAHEVRNPLNAAKLQLELIGRASKKLQDKGRSDRIGERVKIVNSELVRLKEMLDDFLALARQRRMDREVVPVLPLFAEVLELEAPVAAVDGIRLEMAWEGRGSELSINADRPKIKQVLMNLVANAVDAMRGFEGGSVHLGAVDEGDWVALEVWDTGPGIEEAVVGKLFEPFVTTKEAGTGLGLSIVKRIVEAHGGEITVGDRDPHGTVMRFTLPKG
ncbi:MAG: hypothetical protein DRJ42_02690 [Deltaproteobacteria bacterium]|nr:MAG: hypothetical protein DRJ42_02690 [Deltaproteobacteria bacterium]